MGKTSDVTVPTQNEPPDDRAVLADEVMEGVARQADRRRARDAEPGPPERRRRAMLIALGFLAPVLVGIVVLSLGDMRGVPPLDSSLGGEALRRDLLVTVNVVVLEIEAFREDYGELPESLAEVAAPNEGRWRYEPVGNDRYRVGLTRDGQAVAFDSIQDSDVVFAEVRGTPSLETPEPAR